jgi:DNA polymerase-1
MSDTIKIPEYMVNLQDVFQNMNFEVNEEDTKYNNRVLFVDALNTFLRSYAAIPTLDDNGNHIGGMSGFLKSVGSVVRDFKPSRVVIVFDGKGGSQRRRKIFPQYKANRKPPTRLNRQYDMTTEEQETENIKWQLITLIEMLECLPVTIFTMDNIEADDVIAYASELVTAHGGHSIIYSTDKDFLQMVTPSVKVYNPIKKKTFDVDTIIEAYGVHPDNFVYYRSLLGDKSDNIDGIRGAGEKTVLKLLPELVDNSITIDTDFIEQKYNAVKKKPKLIENILNNKDIVERNLQLMQLRDVNISTDAKMKIVHKLDVVKTDLRKMDLTKLMIRSKVITNFPNYDMWITSTFVPLTRFTNGSDSSNTTKL